MKQNLMQMQLKLSNAKKQSHPLGSGQVNSVDLTSRAFFIYKLLLQSQYSFTRKTLASFLCGKTVNLQQKNNQSPPSNLKGYMHLQQYVIVCQLIEVMINLQILIEERTQIKQRYSKRIKPNNKYDWDILPKVTVPVKHNKQVISKNTNSANRQQKYQKSRLSLFLFNKSIHPENISKIQNQIKMKALKQKQVEQNKKRKEQEQVLLPKELQRQQLQQKKKKQQQVIKKQQSKQKTQAQMYKFWLKQKQKMQTFICPNKQIYPLESSKIKTFLKNESNVIQIAGNVLQVQIKQLKQKEEFKKNPIKPLISWSFMKNTLGIDSSQSQNQEKIVPKFQLQNKKVINQMEKFLDLKPINEKENQIYRKDFNEFITNKKSSRKKQAKNTPYLGIKSYPKIEVEQNEQPQKGQESSTSITETNARIMQKEKTKRIMTKNVGSDQKYIIKGEQNTKIPHQHIFAKFPTQSMFNSPYYSSCRRSTVTLLNTKQQKNKSTKLTNEPSSNSQHFFTFKRDSNTFRTQRQEYQETMTVTKKPLKGRTSSFQLVSYARKKGKEERKVGVDGEYQVNEDQQHDENLGICRKISPRDMGTITVAFTKKVTDGKRSLEAMRIDKKCLQKVELNAVQTELFTQTITTPEPRTKDKKTCTNDLGFQASYRLREGMLKRDSFVEELIASVCHNNKQ